MTDYKTQIEASDEGFSIEKIVDFDGVFLVRPLTEDLYKTCQFMDALYNLAGKQPKRLIVDLTAVTKTKTDWAIACEASSHLTGIETKYFGVTSGLFDDDSTGGRSSYRTRISPRIFQNLDDALK